MFVFIRPLLQINDSNTHHVHIGKNKFWHICSHLFAPWKLDWKLFSGECRPYRCYHHSFWLLSGSHGGTGDLQWIAGLWTWLYLLAYGGGGPRGEAGPQHHPCVPQSPWQLRIISVIPFILPALFVWWRRIPGSGWYIWNVKTREILLGEKCVMRWFGH